MKAFARKEIQSRKGEDVGELMSAYDFLEDVNDALSSVEKGLNKEGLEELPNVWIIGLPRAGTTLLYQLLSFHLDVGYITNMAARFWNAPVVGVKLSKAILGDKMEPVYESDYGSVDTAYGPHEFSYFWHRLFKMENMPPYDSEKVAQSIDWQSVRDTFLNINAAFNKCVVYKALDVGYHIKRFNELFPKSLFIQLSRNPIDVACSLACARLKYYDDLNTWWSMFPLEYENIIGLPYSEQIPAQMYYLSHMHEEGFKKVSSQRLLRVTYEDLCSNPDAVIDEVAERLNALSNVSVEKVRGEAPELNATRPDVDDQVRSALLKGLGKYDL